MYEKKKDGNKANPFILPDNYFEDFHEKLMQQLPDKGTMPKVIEMRHPTIRWKKWSYAAIITLTLAIAATATLYNTSNNNQELTEAERNEIIEAVFDSYPIDEYNVYCYLTSSDPNY